MTLSRVRVLVAFLAVVGCETKRQPEYKVVSFDSATGRGEMDLTIS